MSSATRFARSAVQRHGACQAFLVAGTIALSLSSANQARAQASPPSATNESAQGSNGDQLVEVVVTAEKREQGLQKTPVAVTAVSQDELVQAGVAEFTSLQKVAPDVNITNTSSGPTISIRGLYTTHGNSPGAQGTTALYFNGGFLTQSDIQGMMYDLQRVEVDKGPQSTLFGKDAEAGAINFISNKPVLGEQTSSAQLEFGSYDTLRTDGVANIPIGDTFAARVAIHSYSHEGYMDSGLDDAGTDAGRISLLWKPSERESLTLVGDYARDNSRDDGGTVSNITGVMPGITNIYVPPNPRDDTFYNGYSDGPSSVFYRHGVNEGLNAQNDYDLDFATWTTLVSYRHFDFSWVYPTNPGQGPAAIAPNGGSYPSGTRTYNPQIDQFESFESRLTSPSGGPWQWVGGVYWSLNNTRGTMIQYRSTTSTAQSLQIGNPLDVDKSAALFGQATYTPPILDALHLTAGGRLESDYAMQDGTFTQFGPRTAVLLPYSSNSWHAGTYKAELGYDLTANSLLYADTATAFKAGGFGYGPGVNPAVGPITQPEHVRAYEIGSKNRFLNQTLQVNLEAWYYDYTNIGNTLTFYTCTPVCGGLPAITVGNAGEARYHGASADIQYLLTRNDEFKATVSWLYARYGTYIQQVAPGYSLSPGAPVTSNPFLSDTELGNVPKLSSVASYSHTWSEVFGGSLIAELAGQFQTSTLQVMAQDPVYGVVNLRAGGWAMGDASLKYQLDSSRWSFQVYVHNFTNKLAATSEGYSTATHAITASFYPPRIIGGVISATF
jgi:iron complex outermembrane receptor protein